MPAFGTSYRIVSSGTTSRIRTPVSSSTSRTAAAGMLSPAWTFPFGRVQSSYLFRCTMTTSRPRTGCCRVTTAPPARVGFPLVPTDRRVLEDCAAATGRLHPLLGPAPTLDVDQVVLHVDQRAAFLVGGERDPGAVRLQLPRRGARIERQVEQVRDLGDMGRIGDRGE